MGSQLVRTVLGEIWPRQDLTDSARLVICYMAQHAMDADAQPTYFGGWEALALNLGYPDPQRNGAAQRRVTRAIKCLVEAGLVDPDPSWPRHYKRRYRLRIRGP